MATEMGQLLFLTWRQWGRNFREALKGTDITLVRIGSLLYKDALHVNIGNGGSPCLYDRKVKHG